MIIILITFIIVSMFYYGYLVQAKAERGKQAQETDARHPQISQTVLHQHVGALHRGLEGDGLSKGGTHSTPATLHHCTHTLENRTPHVMAGNIGNRLAQGTSCKEK